MLDKNGIVRECRKKDQPGVFYIGSYEGALKYFDVDPNAPEYPDSIGDPWNIIVYYQLSGFALPRLSNEIYDILEAAMKRPKFWVQPDKRHETIMGLIEKAEKAKIIDNDLLIKSLNNRGSITDKRRIFAYNKWLNSL